MASPLPVPLLRTQPVVAPSLQRLCGVFLQVFCEGQRPSIPWSSACLGSYIVFLLFISIFLFNAIIMHLIFF